jgi:hypothetical protein
MAEGPARRHGWLLVLVVVALVAAHALVLRTVWSRMALPAALLLVAVVVAKHLGLAALVRARWRRGVRR